MGVWDEEKKKEKNKVYSTALGDRTNRDEDGLPTSPDYHDVNQQNLHDIKVGEVVEARKWEGGGEFHLSKVSCP